MNGKQKALGSDIQSLIKRCADNDRRAQLLLYDRFVKSMYASCMRLIRNTMEAEDIVQESFIAAFKSLKSFRNEVPFEAWLRRIVINKSLDHLRKQKQGFLELREDALQVPEDTSFSYSAEDLHERADKLQQIRNEVMKLPDGFRVIFSLYYYEGFDHDEIAEIMGITPSTSRSQLVRAKQKIINAIPK